MKILYILQMKLSKNHIASGYADINKRKLLDISDKFYNFVR